MRKSIFVIAALALVFIAGCKKEEDKTGGTVVTPRLVATYSDSTKVTTYYVYTPSGKLSQIRTTANPVNTVFHYNGNTVLVKYEQSGVADPSRPQILYTMNTDGRAQRALYRKPDGTVISKTEFGYDANGNLITEQFFGPGDTVPYFIRSITNSGGNGILVTDIAPDTATTGTTLAEYAYGFYTDKTSSTSNANLGIEFLGKSNKSPESTLTITKGGLTTATATYNYIYDEQGRIVSRVCYNDYQNGAGPLIGDSVVYTYQQ